MAGLIVLIVEKKESFPSGFLKGLGTFILLKDFHFFSRTSKKKKKSIFLTEIFICIFLRVCTYSGTSISAEFGLVQF